MRLWHKDLIPVLPKTQLKQLFRDSVKLLKIIRECGEVSPNDIRDGYSYSTLRVNKYPLSHLQFYTKLVRDEVLERGYKIGDEENEIIYETIFEYGCADYLTVKYDDLFSNWHTDRYLKQCYMFLDEMYCCEKISPGDFEKIDTLVSGLIFM